MRPKSRRLIAGAATALAILGMMAAVPDVGRQHLSDRMS